MGRKEESGDLEGFSEVVRLAHLLGEEEAQKFGSEEMTELLGSTVGHPHTVVALICMDV